MLTFATSLRHPDLASDYAEIEDLLDTTLRSLNRQTDNRCSVIVVSNVPYTAPSDVRVPVESITVDFGLPPDAFGTGEARLKGFRHDKGTKMGVALSRITDGHVMFLDADDFVNRNVAEFVAKNPDGIGWHVDRGIRYDVASGLFRRQQKFNDVCGTSLIIRRSALPTVELPDKPAPQDVIDAYGEDAIFNLFGSHRHLRERFHLPALPMPGAVYSVNNGHNDSKQPALALGRPLSARTAREFGVPRHDPREMWRTALTNAPRGAMTITRLAGQKAIDTGRARIKSAAG